jgi:leader peptidase (prepilin peptidase)/N-methyltransferase
MEIILAAIVFVFGLILGSFANVVIYRIPRKLSIVKPRSQCPFCQTQIRALDNIPILSFIFLGGKCRSCGHKISWQYPIVELINGLLFLMAFTVLIKNPENIYLFLAAIYLSTVFVMIFFIDLDFRIIPDSLSISGIIIGLGVSFLPGMRVRPVASLIGAVVGGLLFMAIAELGDRIFKKESMGGGDIKLAAMLGAFVGWKGLLLILFLASLLGTVIGLTALYMAKDKKTARTIPFGPFLVSAGLIAFYWGEQIIAGYLKLISR